jgi:molecular chaperone DnaK
MVKDAELHADEDKKKRELVEVRNNAESLIHTTERTISESGDKVASGDREAAEAAITALREALESNDVSAIQAKQETLAQVSMKLGEAIYKAGQEEATAAGGAAAGEGQGAPGGAAAGDDKVVDADFEEVDDRKKGA